MTAPVERDAGTAVELLEVALEALEANARYLSARDVMEAEFALSEAVDENPLTVLTCNAALAVRAFLHPRQEGVRLLLPATDVLGPDEYEGSEGVNSSG